MKNKIINVGLIGKTNSGKSTFINSIVGEKISIENKKINTTLEAIIGILNINNTQIIFYDTPGTHFSKSNNIISTSVKNNKGLNKLLTSLSTCSQLIIGGNTSRLDQVLVTKRQRQLLEESMLLINDSINQLDSGVETDIIASTLRSFIMSIRDVVGEIPRKDVMQNIFNSFCVGK